MGWVAPGRWLDSSILGVFLMCLSALTLYLFSELWGVCQNPALQKYNVARGMHKLFPFTKTFDVNLTHILLFALIICLLSLRPDYEAQQAQQELEKNRRKKKKPTRIETDDEAESKEQ